MNRLLREPLVHFLLLGSGLFAAYHLVGKGTGGEPGKIVVTRGQIEHLAAGFDRVHGRPPVPEELEGLIQDYLREEVYCREAVTLGLDRDDAVIRNRLRLKMEFISDDAAALAEPTEAQLRDYLAEHADTFRIEPRFTFKQVYLNPERRRDRLARDTEQLLAELNRTGALADVSALGDSLLLNHEFDSVPRSEVATLFGEEFAAKLNGLRPGQWQGPVESGYGVHLVFVGARTEERVPELEEVRGAVRREWANVQRQQANERFYASLLKQYTVTIEQPELAAGANKLAVVAPR